MRGLGWAIACCALAGVLSACQDSVQGPQLDVNYATTTGVGSMTAGPLKLPHGRYTFFSYADPANCVTSIALLDQGGHVVVDDGSQRAPGFGPPGSVVSQMVPTMVQEGLSSGSYQLRVSATGPVGVNKEGPGPASSFLLSDSPGNAISSPKDPAHARSVFATGDPQLKMQYGEGWNILPP